MSGIQDADGDSQMHSSPSPASSHSSSMFPSANSPTPPVATNPTSLPSLHSQLHALTNELSPPNSQERVRTQDTLIANDSMDVEPQVGHNSEEDNATKGKRVEIATGSEQTMRGGAEHPAEVEDVRQPGWEWKNEKAREEAARSLEQVVDRDFSLEEFGDLFDERQSNGA